MLYIYIYIYILIYVYCIYILSLSLPLYIYIYIYICRSSLIVSFFFMLLLTPCHKVTGRQCGIVFTCFTGSAQPRARSVLQGRDASQEFISRKQAMPNSKKEGTPCEGSTRSSAHPNEGADLPHPWCKRRAPISPFMVQMVQAATSLS